MTCDVHLTRVLGLPAVLRGRSQGHVERAVLENDGHALRGLIVRRGFGGAKWVARDSIALLGDVSVILRACPTHLPRKTDFRLRTVKDTRGLTLGCVTDVLISADNLLVSELEVSLGLIDDFRDGRRRIRHFSASPDGDVLVPEGEILLEREGNAVNKMLIGSAVGLAMGIGLMMLPGIRQDVQKGANKVKKAVQDMSEGQQ